MTEAETTDDASTPASPFPAEYGSVGAPGEAPPDRVASVPAGAAVSSPPPDPVPVQPAHSPPTRPQPANRRFRRGPPFDGRPRVLTDTGEVETHPGDASGPGANGQSDHPPRIHADEPAEPGAVEPAEPGAVAVATSEGSTRAASARPDGGRHEGDPLGAGPVTDSQVGDDRTDGGAAGAVGPGFEPQAGPIGVGRVPFTHPTAMPPTLALPRPGLRRGPGPRPAEPEPPQQLDRRERRTPDWMARRIVEARAPGAAYELGKVRRWRRRKVKVLRSRASRRLIRRIDTWTVFKVSFVFYVLLVAIVLVAGLVTWSVAQHLGFVNDIQKSVRSLADDKSFIFRGTAAFKYSAIGLGVLGLLGTLFNTVAAMLYNLLSDVFGGLQVIVVTEPD